MDADLCIKISLEGRGYAHRRLLTAILVVFDSYGRTNWTSYFDIAANRSVFTRICKILIISISGKGQ